MSIAPKLATSFGPNYETIISPADAVTKKPRLTRKMKQAGLDYILQTQNVTTVLQPILRLGSGEIFAFEALTRPPPGCPFIGPQDLFEFAGTEGLLTQLDQVCCIKALAAFHELQLPGNLFLNVNPASIADGRSGGAEIFNLLRNSPVPPERIVIELTEQHQLPRFTHLNEALSQLRSLGARIAIDDVGQGFSSLWLWSKINPEFVKIDMHFVHDIHKDPIKFQFLKSILQIADNCGARVVAEGIEVEAELTVLRDMGIACGQGYFIAKPSAIPAPQSPPHIKIALQSRGISVFPELVRLPNGRITTGEKLLMPCTPVAPSTTWNQIFERFQGEPERQALPVVDLTQVVGLIGRNTFMLKYLTNFGKELYGKRSCTEIMDATPMIVECSWSINEIGEVLMRHDPDLLKDGFVFINDGRYAGVGSGQALMREITSLRLDAARYANPLTSLPGNVPIDEHVNRLLAADNEFVIAYADLNHFKAFNDVYGYRRGDDMIKLAARLLSAGCDPRVDFIGHIGGDDFILLFQSADWELRCRRILGQFAEESAYLFDQADKARGALCGEDRAGRQMVFPLTSLAIGIIRVEPDATLTHLHVSAMASEAKKQAKKITGNAIFIDRRALSAKVPVIAAANPGHAVSGLAHTN